MSASKRSSGPSIEIATIQNPIVSHSFENDSKDERKYGISTFEELLNTVPQKKHASAQQFPKLIQFFYHFVFGKNNGIYPWLWGGLTLATLVFTVLRTITYGFYIGAKDSKVGAFFTTQAVPSIIFYIVLVTEFCFNLHFGRYLARSRYLENLLTIVEARCPHLKAEQQLNSLVRVLCIYAPSATIICSMTPGAINCIYALDTHQSDDDDASFMERTPGFAMTLYLTFMLTVISVVNFSFVGLWVWLAWTCHQVNQYTLDAITLDGFSSGEGKPIRRICEGVGFMEGVSEPWSMNMIVRYATLYMVRAIPHFSKLILFVLFSFVFP